MQTIRTAALALALVLAPVAMPGIALAGPVSHTQLTAMATGMGFTPKQIATDPAKPKFEIMTKAGTFDVPLGLEVSPSGRFIWVSANLGAKTLTSEQANAILKRAASVQPTQFWYTSGGNLMIGMAIDNREVTPAYLKFVIDKVAADVAATADIWNT